MLYTLADTFSGMLVQPWFSHSCFRSIKNDVAELADVMHQYASFFTGQKEKVKTHYFVTSIRFRK